MSVFFYICFFFSGDLWQNHKHHLLTQASVRRHSRSEREREVRSQYGLCFILPVAIELTTNTPHIRKQYARSCLPGATMPALWIDFDFYLTTHKSKSTQRVLYFNKSKIVCKSIDDQRMGRVIRNTRDGEPIAYAIYAF